MQTIARLLIGFTLIFSWSARLTESAHAENNVLTKEELQTRADMLRARIESFYSKNRDKCRNGAPLLLYESDLESAIPINTSFVQAENILKLARFEVRRPPPTGWGPPLRGPERFAARGQIYPFESRFGFMSWIGVNLFPENPNDYSDLVKLTGAIYCNSL